MTLTGIIIIIAVGILLILVEFLIAPGITIAGIGGLICMAGGVYFAYAGYENERYGHITLAASLLALVVILGVAMKSGTWKAVSLQDSVDGRTATIGDKVEPGDKGESLTRLNPIGKVMVNDIEMEAKTYSQYIDAEQEIEVVKVLSTNIIVKPVNE
jgi:membrane-bound ClpP family serine protease